MGAVQWVGIGGMGLPRWGKRIDPEQESPRQCEVPGCSRVAKEIIAIPNSPELSCCGSVSCIQQVLVTGKDKGE